jgi:hypothetical protein
VNYCMLYKQSNNESDSFTGFIRVQVFSQILICIYWNSSSVNYQMEFVP